MIRDLINKVKYGMNRIFIASMNQQRYINYLRKQGAAIGDNCVISKTANFGSEPFLIKIGDNCRITQHVQFITHDGGLWTLRHMGLIPMNAVKYGNITIGNNSNISWDTIIMPNVHIGDNCVVAAGAVVTHDIPSGEVWGGVPAKRIETINEYYEKITDDLVPTFSMTTQQKWKYLQENKPEFFD